MHTKQQTTYRHFILSAGLLMAQCPNVRAEEAASLLEAAKACRFALRDAELSVRVARSTVSAFSDTRYDIVFCGDDITLRRVQGDTFRVFCRNGNKFVSHHDQDTWWGGDWRDASAAMRADVFDPRLLGVWPNHHFVLHNFKLHDAFDESEYNSLTVAIDDEQSRRCGTEVHNVHYTKRSSGVGVNTWIAPAWNHAVVGKKATSPPGVTLVTEAVVMSDYTQTDGEWFPSRIVCTISDDGVLKESEELRIDVTSLNKGVSPTHFEFSSLEIPKNTRVAMTDGRLKTWNGRMFVTPVFVEARALVAP